MFLLFMKCAMICASIQVAGSQDDNKIQQVIVSNKDQSMFSFGPYKQDGQGELVQKPELIEQVVAPLCADFYGASGFFPENNWNLKWEDRIDEIQSVRYFATSDPLDECFVNALRFDTELLAGKFVDDVRKMAFYHEIDDNPTLVRQFGEWVIEVSTYCDPPPRDFLVLKKFVKDWSIGAGVKIHRGAESEKVIAELISNDIKHFGFTTKRETQRFASDNFTDLKKWYRLLNLVEFEQWKKSAKAMSNHVFAVENDAASEFGAQAFQVGSGREAVNFARDLQIRRRLLRQRGIVAVVDDWVIYLWADRDASAEDVQAYQEQVLLRARNARSQAP